MITFPANIYLFKVNNRSSRKRCEIYSKLYFEHIYRCIPHLFLVFLFANFEQIYVSWFPTCHTLTVLTFLTSGMYMFLTVDSTNTRLNPNT